MSITVLAENPPTIASDAFLSTRLSSLTLYVPFGTKSLYENAKVWKNFGQIIELEAPKCSLPTLTLTEGKLSLTCDTPGAICHLSMNTDVVPATELTALNIEIYATAEGYESSEKVTINLIDLLQAAASRDFNGDGHLSAADVAILVQQVLEAQINKQGPNE